MIHLPTHKPQLSKMYELQHMMRARQEELKQEKINVLIMLCKHYGTMRPSQLVGGNYAHS